MAEGRRHGGQLPLADQPSRTGACVGLNTLFEYNTDLFEAASIRRMLERLVAMLEVIASDADLMVAELP